MSDYSAFATALIHNAIAATPAEAHGLYCGLWCGNTAATEQRWLAELFPATPLEPAAVQLFTALAQQTQRELTATDGVLTLLLPDSDTALMTRATALYDWVRGFLYGTAIAGINTAQLSPMAQEIYTDLTAVTQLDVAALAADTAPHSSEQDLMEIIEFVRVAVMLIATELVTIHPASE